jgi:hypothetical protein
MQPIFASQCQAVAILVLVCTLRQRSQNKVTVWHDQYHGHDNSPGR